MGKLSVTEFNQLGRDEPGSPMPAGELFLHTSQSVDFTSVSSQSADFQVSTRMIRIVSDADCYIEVSDNPVASPTTILVPAGNVEYFGIRKNRTQKIAVVSL